MAAAGNSSDEKTASAQMSEKADANSLKVKTASKLPNPASSRLSDLPRSDSTDPAFFNALYMQEQRAAFGGFSLGGAASASASADPPPGVAGATASKRSASSNDPHAMWQQKQATADLWDVPLSQDGQRIAGQPRDEAPVEDEVCLVAAPQSHPSIPSTASFSLLHAPICVVPSGLSASQRDEYIEIPPDPVVLQSPGLALPSTGPPLLPSTGPSDTSQITLDGPDALLMPLNQRTLAAHLHAGSSSYTAALTLPFSPPLAQQLRAREYHVDTWTAAVRGGAVGAQTTVQQVQSEAAARARLALGMGNRAQEIPPTQEVLSTETEAAVGDTQMHTQMCTEMQTQINTARFDAARVTEPAGDAGTRKRKQRDPTSSPDVILIGESITAGHGHSHGDSATPSRPGQTGSRLPTTRSSPPAKRQRSTAARKEAGAHNNDDDDDELAGPAGLVGARVQVHLPAGPARNGDEWTWIPDTAPTAPTVSRVPEDGQRQQKQQKQQEQEQKQEQRQQQRQRFGEQIADSEEDDDDDDDYPIYVPPPRIPVKNNEKSTSKGHGDIPDTQSFSPPRGVAEVKKTEAAVERSVERPAERPAEKAAQKPSPTRPAAKKQKARSKAAVLQKASTPEPKPITERRPESTAVPATVDKTRKKQPAAIVVIDDSEDDDELSSPGSTPIPDSETEEEAEEEADAEVEREPEPEPARKRPKMTPKNEQIKKTQQRPTKTKTKTTTKTTTSDDGQATAVVQTVSGPAPTKLAGSREAIGPTKGAGPINAVKPKPVESREASVTGASAASASASPSPGPSVTAAATTTTAITKPAYRVGLSRRTRIAPLLKIVRKP